MFWFFISHCKKVLAIFCFLFLKIYDSAQFNNMFQKVSWALASCLKSSQNFELFKYLLYFLRYDIKCNENLKKNVKMHC